MIIMKKLFTYFLLFSCFKSTAQQKDWNYFLSMGLQHSPLLKDYQFQVQGNKIDSQRIKSSYGPQVTGNSNGLFSPVVKSFGYDGTITNLHTFNALLGVSKIIVGKGNINNQYQTLQLQNLSLENQGKISEQDLKKNITQQYITAYGDIMQINFNQDVISLLQNEETILKKLAEKGVYKQTDFLSFLVNFQQQKLVIKQLYIQYQNDFATLNYISGVIDTSYTILELPSVYLPALPKVDETIFYDRFIIDSLKIKNNDSQIDYNYKPRLSILADGGYNSSFVITPYKNFGLSAGVSMTVPIYDGKQRKMLHQKNDIAEQSRKTYQQFFITQYTQQIEQLKQQLLLTEQLIEQTGTQIKYAEGLIKAQRQQLITGDVRIADYIIAIGNYLNAKNIITQNTINKLQIINQLNYWNRKL